MVKIMSGKSVQSGSGGGANVKHSAKGKQEPKSSAMSVEAVAQQGMALAFKHRASLVSGKGYTGGKMGDDGSRSYFNAAKEGPGAGRTIHRSGTQSRNPATHALPKKPDSF
jgi:hypothetical protein